VATETTCLIKLKLPNQLLAEWFTKSFMNDIAHDISMGGVVIEEQEINRAQYLDLVYSQTGTLYDLLPDGHLVLLLLLLQPLLLLLMQLTV
jgi:hypothetical protein